MPAKAGIQEPVKFTGFDLLDTGIRRCDVSVFNSLLVIPHARRIPEIGLAAGEHPGGARIVQAVHREGLVNRIDVGEGDRRIGYAISQQITWRTETGINDNALEIEADIIKSGA